MKRVRKYQNCPNPLFEKWLEEWRKEAIKKDSPLQHSFEKALSSLRKYPLPLSTGKDCCILQYFGHKLCSMLDKKLTQHNKLCGIQFTSAQTNLPVANDIKRKHEEISNNDSNELVKEKKTSNKSYIPKTGSASYIILVTLYKNMKKPNNPGFMYKKDIISEVQYDYSMKKEDIKVLCSSWTCINLLIKKNLVEKKSNPPKYSLTDSGVLLAKKLLEGDNKVSSNNSDEDVQLDGNLKNVQNDWSISSALKSKDTEPESPEKALNGFNYLKKSPANCNSINNLSSSVKSLSPLTNVSKTVKETNFILIDDDDDVSDHEAFRCNMEEKNDCEKIIDIEKEAEKESEVMASSQFNNDSFHKFCKENAESFVTEVQSEYNIKRKKTDEKEKRKGESTEKVIADTQNKVNDFAKNTSTESFYLLPNNFDVILLVDMQETSRVKKNPKDDSKTKELSKLGTLFEVRSLKVGDFTWIARCRLTNRELVLPYIVERKRMDDLSSSIKDGRYHEQKFRLQQSGIRNIIYMIENCGKNYYGSIPMTSLLQAAMNSLVQDNFTVKFTSDHKSSMRYLATMTAMLTDTFEAKELKSCNKEDLSTSQTISESTQLLMEFNEFNKAAVKTKNFNVQEMFLRQLVQLKGLSVEKAMAIVQCYPTPKLLKEALSNGDENLLANITVGPQKRKIGSSISKILYKFYTSLNFV